MMTNLVKKALTAIRLEPKHTAQQPSLCPVVQTLGLHKIETVWVWQLATGGDEENRTPVRKSIHTGVSERRRLFKFPCKAAKRQAALFGSSKSVTA